jgi:acetate kinase
MTSQSPSPLVLAVNAGSSSLKFAVFQARGGGRVLSGAVERIGAANAALTVTTEADRSVRQVPILAPTHAECIGPVIEEISKAAGANFAAVGHRLVFGGERANAPAIVDAALLAELKRVSPLAPEHLPAEIEILEALGRQYPKLPQVACFDTAFHHNLPRVARILPIPRRYEAKGIRRHGFHGLSYEFLMEELRQLHDPAATNGKIILAHLGNGASMAAVKDGKCIDTSMSFTPAAGLVMGRRSGDLDPGLPACLARLEGMTAEQFDRMINHESGMLGVSETASDMRELLKAEKKDPRAAEAVALFCYQARKWIGAFTAALGGLDTLVFAGGIGEHNGSIRARICDGLECLGLVLHPDLNAANHPLISTATSRVAARVIRTDEELMIARSTCRLLKLTTR